MKEYNPAKASRYENVTRGVAICAFAVPLATTIFVVGVGRAIEATSSDPAITAEAQAFESSARPVVAGELGLGLLATAVALGVTRRAGSRLDRQENDTQPSPTDLPKFMPIEGDPIVPPQDMAYYESQFSGSEENT